MAFEHASHDPSCVFCKICAGVLPASTVLETPEVVAFLDIQPINPGHVLLVPRIHHADLSELSDELAARMGAFLPRLARAIRAVTGAPALNVVINNGRAAGQTVWHGHWHLIPRFDGDPVRWPWPQGRYEGDAIERMRDAIADAIHRV